MYFFLLDHDNYKKLVENEKSHFSKLLNQQDANSSKVQKIEPKVNAFNHAQKVYSRHFAGFKADFVKYILDFVENNQEITRILSLGVGTGEWELDLLSKARGKIKLDAVDINDKLLQKGIKYAKENNLDFNVIIQDINVIELSSSKYDFVIGRSALHHFLELEHIFSEINKALKNNGELLVLGETIGRNRLRLFPETEKITQKIFDVLPAKFRFNNYTKETDVKVATRKKIRDSFECIRSEDILSLLLRYFKPIDYVTKDAFISLLLDFRYGPNYDLNIPLS